MLALLATCGIALWRTTRFRCEACVVHLNVIPSDSVSHADLAR